MRRRTFRPDVEGVRAVAILAVVLFHAHLGILGGGYVGVDVFFVVSGFLITGLLWRELEKTGTISYAGFYARRARRLLPASALVIVATVVVAAYVVPPLQAHDVTKDGVSAALYVANYRFAAHGVNYLDSTAPPSPLQHYWSLGVEEQFYLLWPLLLVLGAVWWRGRRRGPAGVSRPARIGGDAPSLPGAVCTLAGIGVLSFLLSLWLTHANQPIAFFSLPTRAWELAAGGLVALGLPWISRWPQAFSAVLGWAGLGTVVWSMIAFSATTPFPGTAALAPILGTVAVLVAGSVPGSLGPVIVLERRPFQVVGKLSYTWYLWHWPVLILAPYVLGRSLGNAANLGLCVLSLALAFATTALVELPIRFSPLLARYSGRSLATGLGMSGTAAVCALAIAGNLPSLGGHGVAPVARISTVTPPAVAPAGPATTLPPYLATEQAVDSSVEAAVAGSVTIEDVPSNLEPSLTEAHASQARPFFDGCFNSFTDATVHHCVYGDAASSKTMVLFGDSHATMWFPTLDALANQRGWRLEALGKATCPPLLIPVFSPVLNRNYSECEQWRQGVLTRIQAERPSLVVLGVARHYSSEYGFTAFSPEWVQGLAAMVSAVRQTGAYVVVMGAIPKPTGNIPDCLSSRLTAAVGCTESINVAFPDPSGVSAEAAAVVAAGGAYLDPHRWFCTPTTCTAMVDNLLVWRDDNHITVPFATYLAPAVGAYLDAFTHGII